MTLKISAFRVYIVDVNLAACILEFKDCIDAVSYA